MSLAAMLASGVPFYLAAAERGQLDGLADPLAPIVTAELLDGPLAGGVLVCPAGEPPACHYVTDADDNGGTVRTMYVLGLHGYRVSNVERFPAPRSGGSTAIDPTLSERFIAAGVRAAAAQIPDDDCLPEPEPANSAPGDRRVWVHCGACRGSGVVVIIDATAHFRRQGYPYTVTAPCGACVGSGGMVSELPDIG